MSLGYLITFAQSVDDAEIVAGVLHLLLDLFMLVLSVHLIGINEVHAHWKYICHISVLTSTAVCLRAVSLLLPSLPLQTTLLDQANSPGFEWASLALLTVACCVIVTMRSGPPLHYRPENIYSPKMLESFSTVPLPEDNVCAVVQASVVESLLFSYTTAVANLAHTSESLEVRDLPIVPAIYRASNLFARMRTATVQDEQKRAETRMKRQAHGQKSSKKWFWQREGSGFPLLARLARINRTALLIEISLAAVTAIFYYIPFWYEYLLQWRMLRSP